MKIKQYQCPKCGRFNASNSKDKIICKQCGKSYSKHKANTRIYETKK